MSTISSDLRTEWSEQLARALVTRGLLPDYVVLPVLARARDAEQPLATLLISEGVATPAVVVSTLAQLVREGVITLDMALDRCRDEEELSQQLSSYR